MHVEQAVFTSARSRRSQGYHLVAVSPGINDQVARQLSLWGPSHASLLSEDPAAESVNFHRLNNDYFAVSRTIHGGAEYSGRAGLQVFTKFLLLTATQLAAYQNNALSVAQTALALGVLRLDLAPRRELPEIDLPDRPVAEVKPVRGECPVPLDSIRRSIALGTRVAILGLSDPLPVLARLLQETFPSERPQLSFSTGLRPSIDRHFQIQFAQRPDSAVLKQFASQGIDQVTAG